jgi:hypothetical protein
MGAEGVPWPGLQPFTAEPHVIQNLGDGTLSHSGTLAIRAAVAAGAVPSLTRAGSRGRREDRGVRAGTRHGTGGAPGGGGACRFTAATT